MRQPGFNAGLATRRAVDVREYPLGRRQTKPRRQELEARFAALQKDYAELHTEIFEAAQVHRRLCAPRLVRREDFEIANEIFAIRQLPGDFFVVEDTSDGVVLALGDICGKGLAAGMWTTHLVSLVSAHAGSTSEPSSIVTRLNRDLCRNESAAPLASLFLARLEPSTGKVNYCSAGHPPGLLLRADGTLDLLSEGGLLLGVVPEAEYVCGSFELGAGDLLLIYSDGVTESQDCAGEEFGDARLEAQLRSAQAGHADAVLFSLLGAVQDFAAASPIVDDMSLAIVRRC